MTIQQTQIRIRIENSLDTTEINALKSETKAVIKEMNKVIREIKEEEINYVVKGMTPR